MQKPQPERVTWASGAARNAKVAGESDRHPRYDLVSPIGHRRLAEVYGEGAKTFGDRNWESGMPTEVILNHLEAHLVAWKAGDRGEDHLAKVAWGLYALMHYEERGCGCFEPCEPACERYIRGEQTCGHVEARCSCRK